MMEKDECGICADSGAGFDYINSPGARAAREEGLINLAELPVGSSGTVEKVSETDHDLAHLVRSGHNPEFVKGLEVAVTAKSPGNGPVIIKAGGRFYDVCHDIASVVWVVRI